MSNKTLPPELVEKMRIAIDSNHYSEHAEKCAQIAVDYADEQVRIGVSELVQDNQELTGENYILKQQRDELLENTRVDNLFLDKWIRLFHMANCHAEILEEMKDTLHQNQQLLKKHEDGKE